MESQDKDEKDQQPGSAYESPKLIRVGLRPEEAVLGHCKVTGTSGPGPGIMNGCRGLGGPCRVPGS